MLNFKQKKNAFIYGFTHAFNGDILGATRLKSLDENIKDFKEKSTQKLSEKINNSHTQISAKILKKIKGKK